MQCVLGSMRPSCDSEWVLRPLKPRVVGAIEASADWTKWVSVVGIALINPGPAVRSCSVDHRREEALRLRMRGGSEELRYDAGGPYGAYSA
jgi:hypothetical protein